MPGIFSLLRNALSEAEIGLEENCILHVNVLKWMYGKRRNKQKEAAEAKRVTSTVIFYALLKSNVLVHVDGTSMKMSNSRSHAKVWTGSFMSKESCFLSCKIKQQGT